LSKTLLKSIKRQKKISVVVVKELIRLKLVESIMVIAESKKRKEKEVKQRRMKA
jgi:hypothetical protein